jgi:hypothetical protein
MLLEGTTQTRAAHPELAHLFRSGVFKGASEVSMVELVASLGAFLAEQQKGQAR